MVEAATNRQPHLVTAADTRGRPQACGCSSLREGQAADPNIGVALRLPRATFNESLDWLC